MEKKIDVVSIRLVKDGSVLSEKSIQVPLDAVEILGKEMCELDREVLCVINLRTNGVPINCNFVSMGAVDSAFAHPREIYKSSILSNATSMIMIHNHPSGNLTPSKWDTMITDRLLKLGDLIGIPLLDHIIVGGDNCSYFSFKEKGILKFDKNTYEDDYMKLDAKCFAVVEDKKVFSYDMSIAEAIAQEQKASTDEEEKDEEERDEEKEETEQENEVLQVKHHRGR